MKNSIYNEIAQLVNAIENCRESNNFEWKTKHEQTINQLVKDYFPSGSGFDSGTKFLLEESNSQRLVFATSFHHMDEHGSYNGWTDHKVIITPCLIFGYDMKVTGRDRNQIKDYIAEAFNTIDSYIEQLEKTKESANNIGAGI